MKKRILSFILVLAIMLGCFTSFASANTVKVIDWLNITDLETPYPGEKPDYTYMFYCEHTSCILYSDQNPTSTWKNGISWKDVTENRYLVPDVDTFIEGHEYMVIVETMVEDGFEFYVADGNRDGNNVDLFLNSKFVPNRSTNQYDGKRYALFSYEYGVCKKKATELTLDFVRPVYNGKLSDINMTLSPNLKVLSSSWTEDGAAVNDTARFKAGKEYRYSVDLVAADGFAFPHVYNNFSVIDRDLITFKRGMVSVGWSQVYDYTDQLVMHVEYVFRNIVDSNVTHIALPDIDTPVAGESPDTSFDSPYGTNVINVWWEDENGFIANTHKFESGKKYTVNIVLDGATGFNMNPTHATVCGKAATVSWNEQMGAYVVTYTFEACAGAVSAVDVTITPPKVGEALKYDPAENGDGYSINKVSYNPNYSKGGAQWRDVTNAKELMIGKTAEEKCVYRAKITVELDEGFEFTNKVTATVNGKEAYFEDLENGLANIYYYFEPVIADNPCKNGHSFTNYVYNGDATAEKDGTKTAKCAHCAATDTVNAEGTKFKNPFTDVKEGKFYYAPVLWAVNKGITAGVTPTTFCPGDTCTRGQVVSFLWRAAGSPEPKTTKNPFTDVKEKAYYYKAVLWAVENGITAGTSPTTFEPGADCTRGQIVAFLWRSQGSPKVEANNPFTDVKDTAYYNDAVKWAVKNGITAGINATTFAPKDPCTRGQIVSFLYRCLGK